MPIRIEKNYPVFTIINDSPEKRNAVDGLIAKELTEAFRAFEQDNNALVAILGRAGRNFCAGADLTVISKSLQLNSIFLLKSFGLYHIMEFH